jgi:ligand-binding SRPBCC domain-containing protein
VPRHFQTEQWVPYPKERVFAFFANPANLPPLMPAWQQAKIEKADLTTTYAEEGSVILISFRPLPFVPLRMMWEACITDFRWNEYFCDEQRKGPFRYFRHCHRVKDEERAGTQGTTVTDAVDYELPLGPPAGLMLKPLFAHRQKLLPRLLAQS